MNKTLKWCAVTSIITTLITTQIPTIAESVEVAYNKIKVTVNGKTVTGDNIIINGRTYVPLRAISEILNKDVIWDANTSTAAINDKDYLAKQNSPGFSRETPAELNAAVEVKFQSGYDSEFKALESTARVTVKEIIRGDAAWQMIKEENQYNKQPDAEHDYLLAKIKFELITAKEQYALHNSDLTLVSSDGKGSDTP
jgi:hypothetical protein